jgi:hypothetical protein
MEVRGLNPRARQPPAPPHTQFRSDHACPPPLSTRVVLLPNAASRCRLSADQTSPTVASVLRELARSAAHRRHARGAIARRSDLARRHLCTWGAGSVCCPPPPCSGSRHAPLGLSMPVPPHQPPPLCLDRRPSSSTPRHRWPLVLCARHQPPHAWSSSAPRSVPP